MFFNNKKTHCEYTTGTNSRGPKTFNTSTYFTNATPQMTATKQFCLTLCLKTVLKNRKFEESRIKCLWRLAVRIQGYDPFLIQQNTAKLPDTKSISNKDRLKKVAKELEGLFLSLVFKQMRKTVPKTDFLHGGLAEDIFEDLLWDRYAQKAAEMSKFGIAKKIYDQYSKFVEK